jgi:hypothetical protein
VGEGDRKMVVGRHSNPYFGDFSEGMWDGTCFLGRRTRIDFKNKRLKKGCFFQSIGVFGIVFGMDVQD